LIKIFLGINQNGRFMFLSSTSGNK